MTETLDERLAHRLARARARKTVVVERFPARPAGTTELSDAQRRLWFLHQWAPDSAGYTIPVAWRLRGPLDVAGLRAALSTVVERHEILRTRYPAVDGEPVAVVDPPAPISLPVMDIPEHCLDAGIEALAREPFDLAGRPPLRAALLRRSAQDHVLVLCLHHIAADGWSVGLLAGELAAAYTGTALPEPVQYADVTYARRGSDPDAELRYWLDRLAGAAPALDLPTDRPRSATPADSGALYRFRLDEELTAAVRRLATRSRATTYMVLLGAFQALCARYTASQDILVGTAVADRDGVAGVIGCFLDTIVVRTAVTPGITGAELLQRVRDAVLADAAHARLPFDRLVRHLPRSAGRHPLYQVQVVATNVPRVPLSLPGLEIIELAVDPGATKVDLSLAVEDLGEPTIALTATYSTELFDAETISRLGEHLCLLLAGLAGDPSAPVDRIPLCRPEEGPLPEPPSVRLLDRFDEHMRDTPDRLAVRAAGGALSYAELDRAARELAGELRGAGVVGVHAVRETDFLVAVLAAWRAGAAYLPIEPTLPPARQDELLAAAGAAILVSGKEVRRLDGRGAADGDLAYLMFTSGSTGTPKAVAVTHTNLAAYLAGIHEVLRPEPGASHGVCSTLAADLGHTMLFGALWSGGTVRLLDPDLVADPDALAAHLGKHPIDLLKIVPSQLGVSLGADRAASLLPKQCLVLGGEAASWELIDRVRALRPGLRIVNHYGPTETTVGVLTYEVTDERPTTVPLGRPLPHVRARILDAAGHAAPVGVPGELCIAGPAVAAGYLGDPERTAERFGTGPGGERTYRTGDRARWRPDGTVEFLGRLDRQVKIRGFRVEPGEVEAVLRAQPGVTAAAVTVAGDRLVGYVAGTVDGLADRLAALLPAHLLPSALIGLDALPLTVNGKIDYGALPAPGQPAGPSGEAPRTRLERVVAGVFAEVLGLPVATRDADFFALGGHSLLATRAVTRLRRELSVVLPVPALFAHPTVAGLAAEIESLRHADYPALRPGGEPCVSFAQRRLWFLDQAMPGHPFYNLPYAVRLTGDLEVSALRAALSTVVERHEVLRTVFPDNGSGEPAPAVLPPAEVSLPITDLRGRPDGVLRREIDAEFQRGFDLAAGPLLRARLLRVEDNAHVLLLTFHHIVFDGWSFAVFADELAAAYSGRPLAPVTVTSADHARWQRDRDHADDLAYWRSTVDGAPPGLDLPADRPRPPRPSYTGGAVPVSVAAEVSDPLLALGRTENATAFMTLMAAYQVLLARYANVDDLVVGVPTAGRDHPDTEGLIGFFVNMLPIRGRPSAELTFREYLRQVRDTCLGAFGYADLPFERLVAELAGARDPSRPPVFGTMFALQNMPTPGWDLPGLTATRIDGPTGIAKLDLSLILVEEPDGLRGAIEYSADLFDAATARRIAGYLDTLLRAIVADPDRPIGELSLLPQAESHRMLVEWNDTGRALPQTSVPQRIAEWAQREPDAIAVSDATTTLTYAELDRAANRLAWELREHGVGPETVVGVALRRSAGMMVGLLGVLRAGGAYLPLDPDYPSERLGYMLTDSGAAVLITDTGLAFDGPVVDPSAPRDHRPDTAPPPPGADQLAYLIYTSGSTGRPKGVAVQHGSLANLVSAMAIELRPGPADVFLGVTTLSFDMAVLELWLPLVVGARLDVVDRNTARDGAALAHRLADATVMQATPATWRLLLDAGWPGHERLHAICGGEALPAELAGELRPRVKELWNLYGPTEATVWSTARRITGPEITVGRPLANTTAYVLDARRRPVPIGTAGELYLGGANLARGYHDRPELTEAAFVPNPFGPGRLYRTGDFARYRADGEIVLLGRADGQIKLRGYRIEVGEIEAVLGEHPEVRRAVVVLRPDRSGEPMLVAYVLGEAAGLAGWLGTRLPAHMVPARFVALDAFPLTPNGKVDRAALPEPVLADTTVTAPGTPTEARVAAAFEAILDRPVGPDDDFFTCGGDSMRAVRAVRRIDPSLSVLDLFTHPTVRGLARHLDGTARASGLLHRMTPTAAAGAEVTIVAVPFGGAGAIVYRDLATRLPATWSLYAVQPPGRDRARPEEPAQPVEALAEECAALILAEQPKQIVLYGHCAGASLATLIARRLTEAGRPPLGIVAAAAFPNARMPGVLGRLARLAPGRRLSDRLITDELRALGGLADELPDAERRQLAAAIRHDAGEAERFYTAPAHAVPAPVLVLVGEDDKITEFHEERAHEWAAYASDVDTAVVPGAGHFFTRVPELAAILRERITGWLGGDPPVQPPRVPPAPRLGGFLRVACGQLISLIGSGLSTFALGVWVYQRTGAVSAFAAIAAFAVLPAILAAPLAGAVADRYERRRVMICCDLAALASALGVAVLLSLGELALWQLYGVVIVSALATTFRQPAYLAAVAQLTPKRYLGQANGIVGLGTAGGTLVAQLAGGTLAVTLGLAAVIWIDVGTFALALASLIGIRFPDLGFVRREGPLVGEIRAGWRYLRRQRGLVALTVFFAVANALGAVVVVLVTPMVLDFASPATLGVVLAAQGAGLLAGSVIMAWWGGTRRRAAGMIVFVGLFAVSAIVAGLRPLAIFPTLGMFGIGCCAALINAHWLALVQVKVRLDQQGRVLSTCLMLARLLMPVGYLISGPLTDHVFGPATVMILTGLVALGWTVAGYRYRPLREADASIPAASTQDGER